MIGPALGLVGAGLTGAASGAYLAYTLGGVEWLRAPLLRFRRIAMFAGVATSATGFLVSPRNPVAQAGLGFSLVLVGYALRRQWLWPRSAPRYESVADASGEVRPSCSCSCSCSMAPLQLTSGLVVVLPGAVAVPLRTLARDRVALVGPWLVVHCGLARSVAVFRAPDGAVKAVLPHASGFYVQAGDGLFDGVDGSSVDGGIGLERQPLRITTREAAKALGMRVFASPDTRVPPRTPTPRVPGARGVEDPMAFGEVRAGHWSALDLLGTNGRLSDYVLSRWAARTRGLTGT